VLGLVGATVVGLVLLAYAADQFVVGSARLAVILRLPPVVIGAVVIGFGTSSPELVVSGIAAGTGNIDVGVGNIVGSNVANLTLILGAAAVLLPLTVRSSILKREAPLSVLAVLVFALLLQGGLVLVEAVVLLVLLAAALLVMLRVRLPGEDDTELAAEVLAEFGAAGHRLGPESGRTVLGLVGTVGGAWALVWGAKGIAEELGLSGGFIGVTLVAVGTSLPELVTAVAAARHKEQELVVGNLLGSNLFNSLAVGGAIGVLGPGLVPEPALTGVLTAVMVAVAVAAMAIMVSGACVTRLEGVALLVVFAAFLVASYLTQPDPVALAATTSGL
jgi:cation:H+ antiporter